MQFFSIVGFPGDKKSELTAETVLWNLDYKGSELKYATTEEDRNKLWKARHDMHWAIRNYKPGYIYHGTDICVPISKLPEAIEYCQKLFQILGVEGKFYRIAARFLVGKPKVLKC